MGGALVRLAVALALVGALLAAARRAPGPAALPPEATFRLAIGEARLTIAASGELSSSVEQSITLANISGQIEEIVEEGSRVNKGDVVARLSTFQWEEQERAARQDAYRKAAEMKRTQRENAALAADEERHIASSGEELDYNRRVLAYLESGPDPRTVQAMSLRIEKARLDDAALSRRLSVQEALKERGFLSELDYESIKTERARAQLERAKQENLLADKREGPRAEDRDRSRLMVDRFGVDLDLARRAATSAEALRALALSKKEAELKDRQAAVEEKRKLKDRAVIRAPIAGTVIYGQAARGAPMGVGATVWSGVQLAKIVERGTMLATLDVPERWLDRVQVGQPVRVRAAHRPAEYAGKVQSVAKLATSKDDDPKSPRTFTVVVRLDVDAPALKPNMTCEADIQIGAHDGVARLPVDLVRGRKDGAVQLVARRGDEHVDVTARLVDEDLDFVYVTGLRAGEVLVY